MASVSSVPPVAAPRTALIRFSWFVVAYNVLVILWGALVRATGSGAGCGNHWPLCNGQVVPLAPTLHTIIEFTHRCMVGGSTFVVVALLVWTLRSVRKGEIARTAAIVSMLLLLNEAFLGALLVKLGYVTGNQSVGRVVVLAIHLSNTLLLLASLTVTARYLGVAGQWSVAARNRLTRWIASLTTLIVTIGVGVSGSMAALGDTLFPASSLQSAMSQDFASAAPWLLRVRWVHPASAVVAGLLILWMCWQTGFGRMARVVLALLCFQFVLGMADVLLLAPTWLQITHLFGADLFWIALVLLAIDVADPARRADLAA